jgi:signal transduction histidine kinase
MTDNCGIVGEQEIVQGREADENAELRASRKRLLLAADAERRSIERALHDGLQQRLVGLAADLELASRSVESDPQAAREQLAAVRRQVGEALEEMRALAHRIHPPLEAGGLVAALRSAAADAGVRTRIDLAPGTSVPTELAGAVYFCCHDVLRHVDGAATAIAIRERDGGIAFEIVVDGEVDGTGTALRDRVEALGGRLTVRSEPGPRTVWDGFLPVER